MGKWLGKGKEDGAEKESDFKVCRVGQQASETGV